MKQMTKEEFFEAHPANIGRPLYEEEIGATLRLHPSAKGLILFCNQQMDSSEFGRCSAVVFGPHNTFKSVEDVQGQWLGDAPSRWQFPIGWIAREDFFK